MGTRSFITIKHKDNTYSGVYCHWDGYPEWNGEILKKDYQARSKVVDLIDGGDISSLKTTSTWDSELMKDENGNYINNEDGTHKYTNTRDAQPLYYYERGETDEGTIYPKHFKTHQQMYKYAKDCCCEFIYTFDDTVGEDQPWWSFCGVN
jgi:hypothetical protein